MRYIAFFLERLAALLAHRSQRAASLGAGVPHRPHKPAARRMAYCSRSLSRRATWHGSHTVPPSTGGCVPQRVHVRASCRARSRRLLLSRANARHRSASLPPYGMPAALAFAHLARSALRLFSPQCRHKVRSGAGLAFPHLGHMPRAVRSAVMRSYRRRPPARSFSGSLYGMFLPSAVVVLTKDVRRPQVSDTCRSRTSPSRERPNIERRGWCS